MILKRSNRIWIAAFLLSIGVSANVFAQQIAETPGVVRISDGKRGATPQNVDSGLQQVSSNDVVQTGIHGYTGAYASNMGSGCPICDGQSGNCPNGDCQFGNCPGGAYGHGYGWRGHGCWGRGCRHCCFQEHYCKHSPDYGYSPPAKYPLQRRGVEYNYYFPAKWYGAGGEYLQSQAPMVYQPTDTTQLGFYYQQVPFWMPQPGRIPPRPIPAQWHIVAPTVAASNFCGPYGCYNGMGGCPNYGHGHGHRNWWGSRRQAYNSQNWYYVDCPQGAPSTAPNPLPASSQDGTDTNVAPQPIESAPPSSSAPAAMAPVREVSSPSTIPAIPGATTQTSSNQSL